MLSQLNLTYAFLAGMFATVNPCGWAMLPSFVSYYLGSREENYAHKSLIARTVEGVWLGVLVAAGFLIVFGLTGIVISAGLRVIVKFMPVAAVAVGIALLLLGVYLLAGKSLSVKIPWPNLDLSARSSKSVFYFGLAYGFASLSCTLPVFLAVVGVSLTEGGLPGTALMFSAYAVGATTVLIGVAIGAALFKGVVTRWFKKLLPYMHRVSASLLILAGAYLIWFQGRFLYLVVAAIPGTEVGNPV